MRTHDFGKMFVLLVTIVGAVVLLAMSRISEAAGVGLITYAIGYVTGNGRLAIRREAPSPVLVSKPRPAAPPAQDDDQAAGE